MESESKLVRLRSERLLCHGKNNTMGRIETVCIKKFHSDDTGSSYTIPNLNHSHIDHSQKNYNKENDNNKKEKEFLQGGIRSVCSKIYRKIIGEEQKDMSDYNLIKIVAELENLCKHHGKASLDNNKTESSTVSFTVSFWRQFYAAINYMNITVNQIKNEGFCTLYNSAQSIKLLFSAFIQLHQAFYDYSDNDSTRIRDCENLLSGINNLIKEHKDLEEEYKKDNTQEKQLDLFEKLSEARSKLFDRVNNLIKDYQDLVKKIKEYNHSDKKYDQNYQQLYEMIQELLSDKIENISKVREMIIEKNNKKKKSKIKSLIKCLLSKVPHVYAFDKA